MGGINVDISGTADSGMMLGDSNPGQVHISMGGVGRNIAENLLHLGCRVQMVTCLGDDLNAQTVRAHCETIGLDLSLSETVPGMACGTYLCLNDARGDLLCAVSDMRICECITPEFLAPRMDAINISELVVVDSNLPEASLRYLADHCIAPLCADPVSISKSMRLSGVLGHLYAIKPNRPEAEKLTGISIHGTEGLDATADHLLEKGVRNVFISLGASGVFYASKDVRGVQACLTDHVVNTNGCGDAFFASACLALQRGGTIARAALLGQAASAICAESPLAVNPSLSLDAVLRRAEH